MFCHSLTNGFSLVGGPTFYNPVVIFNPIVEYGSYLDEVNLSQKPSDSQCIQIWKIIAVLSLLNLHWTP